MSTPAPEMLQERKDSIEPLLREAIQSSVEENAVIFRGLTEDQFLFFERKDRSTPLPRAAAVGLAQAIVGNIQNLGTVDGIDVRQFLKRTKGLRIA